MLVFVTSLKHPATCDYAIVAQLFEVSLRSVCHQTDPNFRVVVVCNARPAVGFDDERVVYHVVDVPPPTASGDRSAWSSPHQMDKGTKLLSGMLLARRFNPDYFAIFDADDLVSKRMAIFANARPGTAGWFVDSGYVLNHSTQRFRMKYGLVRYCGTSLIPSAEAVLRLAEGDRRVDEFSAADQLTAGGRRFVCELLGDHRRMLQYFRRPELGIRRMPFPAAVWVQATGENQNRDPGIAGGLPLSARFCDEFGLRPPVGPVPKPTVPELLDEALSRLQSRSGALLARVRGEP